MGDGGMKDFQIVDSGVEDGVEWFTARAPLYGAANGYVRVPEDHPWHGLSYYEIPQDGDEGPTYVSVHGGLTYAKNGVIGFDTLHAGDIWPGMSDAWPGMSVEWTDEKVAAEAKSLARQVAQAKNGVMRHPVLSVDLDSTLADTRHRKGIIEQFTSKGLPVDWEEYAKACAEDALTSFGEVLRVVQSVIPWVVVSGRSEGAREATLAWLQAHGLKPEAVYLEDGQTEKHYEMGHAGWKVCRLLEVIELHPTIKAHVDDWDSVSTGIREATDGQVVGVTVTPPGMVASWPDNPVGRTQAL